MLSVTPDGWIFCVTPAVRLLSLEKSTRDLRDKPYMWRSVFSDNMLSFCAAFYSFWFGEIMSKLTLWFFLIEEIISNTSVRVIHFYKHYSQAYRHTAIFWGLFVLRGVANPFACISLNNGDRWASGGWGCNGLKVRWFLATTKFIGPTINSICYGKSLLTRWNMGNSLSFREV